MRGRSHDRLARTACGSRSAFTGHPRTRALGYLLAALALLVLAPPAILGWLAGAWVVRGGWVSRGRLAAAASVTGALALLVIGPHGGRWQVLQRPTGRSEPATTAWPLWQDLTQ